MVLLKNEEVLIFLKNQNQKKMNKKDRHNLNLFQLDEESHFVSSQESKMFFVIAADKQKNKTSIPSSYNFQSIHYFAERVLSL